MAILNTKIVLRNDITANWEASNVVLLKGEIGIEFLADGSAKMKVGDGVKKWAELDYVTSAETVDLNGDNKTIVIENGTAKLYGFEDAAEGAQPRKKADGTIEWVVPSTETVDGLQTIVSGLQTDVNGLQTDVGGLKTSVSAIQEILTPSAEGEKTLVERITEIESAMSGTGEGSVEQKISTEVAAQINNFATKVTEGNGTVDTFKELVDYVASHGNEVADMVTDITTLQSLVGNTSVADQISAAIDGIEAGAQVNKIEAIKLGETLLDIVEKTVTIPIGAGLKASDEVTIATDGTLGIGEINVNKLVQDADSELILDGGSAA